MTFCATTLALLEEAGCGEIDLSKMTVTKLFLDISGSVKLTPPQGLEQLILYKLDKTTDLLHIDLKRVPEAANITIGTIETGTALNVRLAHYRPLAHPGICFEFTQFNNADPNQEIIL